MADEEDEEDEVAVDFDAMTAGGVARCRLCAERGDEETLYNLCRRLTYRLDYILWYIYTTVLYINILYILNLTRVRR